MEVDDGTATFFFKSCGPKEKGGDYYEVPIFGSGRKSGQFFSQARQKIHFNFIILGFVRAFENCLGGWLKKVVHLLKNQNSLNRSDMGWKLSLGG